MKQFGSNHKKQIRRYVAHQVLRDSDWAEFGVARGRSARFWLKHMPADKKLYLFDSFEGLPEDWQGKIKKGTFKCAVPALDDKRVEIVKGWFQDTVPRWAKSYRGKLSFVHIDCDLYSSTKTVLHHIYPIIDANTVFLFDEVQGNPAREKHEGRAFKEFLQSRKLSFEPFARCKQGQLALRLRWP